MKQEKCALTILFILFMNGGFAQQILKIGHVNTAELISKMPESDSIQNVLDKEAKEMENMYTELIREHEKNVQKFEAEKSNYSDFVRETKESELIESAQKIQNFQQTAGQQLQKRNLELNQPVYQKLNNAISKVAIRNNFTYILDLSNGSVAFHSAESKNINQLVFAELGIDE